MNKTALWAVALKDMRSIVMSVKVWLPMLVIPIILGVISPVLMIILIGFTDLERIDYIHLIMDWLDRLKGTELYDKMQTFPTLNHQLVYLLVVYLLTPFFLVIPIMSSSIVAANSFVGEKERKTLESLLLSPIDMKSLFIGKVLSAFIPSIAITIFVFILFCISVNIITYPLFEQLIVPTKDWAILIGWVTPSVSLLVILFNVLISSKVRGFQEAYQLGSIIVIPIIMLVVSQLTGVLLLDVGKLFLFGLLFLFLDLLLFQWISKNNQRLKLGEKYL